MIPKIMKSKLIVTTEVSTTVTPELFSKRERSPDLFENPEKAWGYNPFMKEAWQPKLIWLPGIEVVVRVTEQGTLIITRTR